MGVSRPSRVGDDRAGRRLKDIRRVCQVEEGRRSDEGVTHEGSSAKRGGTQSGECGWRERMKNKARIGPERERNRRSDSQGGERVERS